jgi:hypothetical protein
VDTDWAGLVSALAIDLATLEYRQFVVVEFLAGLEPNPYAQAAPEFGGDWYCEVASEHFLPVTLWPLDGFSLVAGGWEPPERPGENWARDADDAYAAAAVLMDSLRFGRACQDPGAFVWTIGRFPPRPDDDGDRDPIVPRDPFGLAA